MSWRLDSRALGVLVVDAQERLLPAMANGERIAQRCALLLDVAEIFSLPAFVTEQAPEKLGPTAPALGLGRREVTLIPKRTFSAFPVLPALLPKTILLAGVETHICIRQTAHDLREHGHLVHVLGDAVSSRAPLDHELALAELRRDGFHIPSVESVAWELAGGIDSPHFRAVLALLK